MNRHDSKEKALALAQNIGKLVSIHLCFKLNKTFVVCMYYLIFEYLWDSAVRSISKGILSEV